MKIIEVERINFDSLHKVLSSNQFTEVQKTKFMQENKIEIAKVLKSKISSTSYKTLMKNRNLKKFRPLKNSFTKKGDKIILAKALNINPSEVNSYIKVAKENIYDIKKIDFLK